MNPEDTLDGSAQETLDEHTAPTYLKPNRHDRRRAAALKRKERKQKGKGK